MLIKSFFNRVFVLSAMTLVFSSSNASTANDDFILLDIEELMDVEVYSVSRSKQSILDSAAAVYVIDKQQIKNSGLQSVPELLRLAPGVQVAQMSSTTWSISMRGFGGKHENKLLVMMDGRSLYTPFFSGVYWGMQDINLDNIERIEVIRGPGGTLWGANAVNGVINIITKATEDTLGGLIKVLAGNKKQGIVSARYGTKLDEKSSYRLSAKYAQVEPFELVKGETLGDIKSQRVSFRYDREIDEKQNISLMGRLSDGKSGSIDSMISPVAPYVSNNYVDIDHRGYDLQFDYNKVLDDDAEISIKTYYEHLYRLESLLKLDMDIFNLDFQHSFKWQDKHHIVWGAGYRYLDSAVSGNQNVSLTKNNTQDYIASLFIQDDISLVPNAVFLTLGAKLEQQSFTGTEIQPNMRLRWKMNEQQSTWAAISRAIRTPSMTEKYMNLRYAYFPYDRTDPSKLGSGGIMGNSSMKSEKLIAYELGFKQKFSNSLNMDVALFYHDYDELRDHRDPLTPQFVLSPIPHLEFNTQFNNVLKGKLCGLEIASSWNIRADLLLHLNYSYTSIDIDSIDGSANQSIEETEERTHQHMATANLHWQINSKLDVGSQLYYYSGLDYPSEKIDAFIRWDLRLGYQLSKNLELSVVGQNLFNDRHKEYYSAGDDYNAYIVPTYYLQASLKF